jgi:hypothetical protein
VLKQVVQLYNKKQLYFKGLEGSGYSIYPMFCHLRIPYIAYRRWVDNIKMDLKEIGWDGMDLIDLAQDRDQWRSLVNMVMNLRVP